jgi:hypothetical protein
MATKGTRAGHELDQDKEQDGRGSVWNQHVVLKQMLELIFVHQFT